MGCECEFSVLDCKFSDSDVNFLTVTDYVALRVCKSSWASGLGGQLNLGRNPGIEKLN
jgi:hypothetical protein